MVSFWKTLKSDVDFFLSLRVINNDNDYYAKRKLKGKKQLYNGKIEKVL